MKFTKEALFKGKIPLITIIGLCVFGVSLAVYFGVSMLGKKVQQAPIESVVTDNTKTDADQPDKNEENGNVPVLEIKNEEDMEVAKDSVVVIGKTDNDSVVSINGTVAKNAKGMFSENVALKEGDNVIKVEATSKTGEVAVKSLSVKRIAPTVAGVNDKKKNTSENTIIVTRTKSVNPVLSEINLSYYGNGQMHWSTNGVSKLGYKLIWSRNQHPTTKIGDGDKYLYFNSGSINGASVSAFDGPGKYYVRVCNYTGSGCDVYSNEQIVTLD